MRNARAELRAWLEFERVVRTYGAAMPAVVYPLQAAAAGVLWGARRIRRPEACERPGMGPLVSLSAEAAEEMGLGDPEAPLTVAWVVALSRVSPRQAALALAHRSRRAVLLLKLQQAVESMLPKVEPILR